MSWGLVGHPPRAEGLGAGKSPTNGEAFQAENLGGMSEQDAGGDARFGLFPQPAGLFGVVMFRHGTTESQAPARWFMGC